MSCVIWLLCCVFVGYCANCKGRSGVGWGAASMFFTPIIVGIVLALMPSVVKKKTIHRAPAPSPKQEPDDEDMEAFIRYAAEAPDAVDEFDEHPCYECSDYECEYREEDFVKEDGCPKGRSF